MRLRTAGLTLGLVLAGVAPAEATDTWSDPYPGVRHLHRRTATPWNIHALVVDLCAPGVSVRATAPSERGQTVSAFGRARSAEAAINGDFFSFGTYQPSGLAIGGGTRWSGTSDPSWEGFVAFGADRADLSDMTQVVSSPPAWMHQVVSGRPQVVHNGAVVTQYNCSTPGNYCVRDPRTGVGLSQNRRKLYLAVVDGRSSASVGMTSAELGTLLHGLGAYDALSLDSGGSTEMWLRGVGVLNVPSDGSERVVANHLAIHASGSGGPASCTPLATTPDAGADAAPAVDAASGDDAAAAPDSGGGGGGAGDGGAAGGTGGAGAGGASASSGEAMAGGCAVGGRARAPAIGALALGGLLVGVARARRRRRARTPGRALF